MTHNTQYGTSGFTIKYSKKKKKGQTTVIDLWQKSGGRKTIIQAFVAHGLGKGKITVKSEIWS